MGRIRDFVQASSLFRRRSVASKEEEEEEEEIEKELTRNGMEEIVELKSDDEDCDREVDSVENERDDVTLMGSVYNDDSSTDRKPFRKRLHGVSDDFASTPLEMASRHQQTSISYNDAVFTDNDDDKEQERDSDITKDVEKMRKTFEFERCALLERFETEKRDLLRSMREDRERSEHAQLMETNLLRQEIERHERDISERDACIHERYRLQFEQEKCDVRHSLLEQFELFSSLESRLRSVYASVVHAVECFKIEGDEDAVVENISDASADNASDVVNNDVDMLPTDANMTASLIQIRDECEQFFLLSKLDQDNLMKTSESAPVTEHSNLPDENRRCSSQASDASNGSSSNFSPRGDRNRSRDSGVVSAASCSGRVTPISEVRKTSVDDDDGDNGINEQNEFFRKQKQELVRVFAEEKSALIEQLAREKTEHEFACEAHMRVERRAWREAVEEFEREVAIMRFEREQMDRNYCLEVDKMKSEFERERLQWSGRCARCSSYAHNSPSQLPSPEELSAQIYEPE